MPNFTTARDEINELFETKWLADTPAFVGTAPKIFFETVADEGQQPQDDHWARIQIRHTTAEQAALTSSLGERRFRKFGIVTVQVFALNPTGNLQDAEDLAGVAKSAFEGAETPSHVWFRNARAVEVGQDGNHFQMNVISEFEYDEFIGP